MCPSFPAQLGCLNNSTYLGSWFYFLPHHGLSPWLPSFPQSPHHLLGFLWKFHCIAWMINSLTIGDWVNFQLLSFLEIRVWDWKFQLSNNMVGSTGNQVPTLGVSKKHLYHSHYLRNPKDCMSSLPEIGRKIKYINHNITQRYGKPLYPSLKTIQVHDY